MTRSLARLGILGLILGIYLAACSNAGMGPSGIPGIPNTSKYVAVYGDSQTQLLQAASQARAAGKTPIFITVRALRHQYVFPVYGQFLRSKYGLIVEAYQRVYVFPLQAVRLTFAGGSNIALETLPRVKAGNLDRLVHLGELQPGVFGHGPRSLKAKLCADCIMLVLKKTAVAAYGNHWSALQDPWQVSPQYVTYVPKNVHPFTGTCATNGTCGPCGADVCSYASSGGTGICSSIGLSSGGAYGGGGGSGGGPNPLVKSHIVQSCIPGGGPSAPGGAGGGAGTLRVHKIYNEALYWHNQKWSTKSGPDNGKLACAWAVNQILQAAVGMVFGTNPNDVSSVESALQNAESSGTVTQVSQSNSEAGDIIVQGDDQHIGICADAGCTTVWSNSSGDGCWCWDSGPGFDPTYNGNPPSRIYHVNG